MTDTADDIKIDFDSNGKSLIVEFSISKIIADWSLVEIRGNRQQREWEGRTDDNVADAVPIDPKSLDRSSQLGWTLALFAPPADTDVSVIVDVRQGNREIARREQTVKLDANSAKLVAGTISFKQAT
jgi:hypothetical protein